MADARWTGGPGERLAGFAALGVALACILCCGKGGPAWSPDGRRVVFDYTTDAGHAALADYDVESGRIRTLCSGGSYQQLFAVDLDADGRVVLIGTEYDEPEHADVLIYDGDRLRRVGRLEYELALWVTYMPLLVHGDALWYTELTEQDSSLRVGGAGLEGESTMRTRTRRLDLATGAIDEPFGEREVVLVSGPAGVYAMEVVGEGEVRYGRATLDELALVPLAIRPLDEVPEGRDAAAASALAVGSEHLALLVRHGDAGEAGEEGPGRYTLVMYDLAGERVSRRELSAPWSMGLPVLEPGDRYLTWLAEESDGPVLLRYDIEAGELARRELPDPTAEGSGVNASEPDVPSLAVSPTGRHLAVTIGAPPGSRLPDLYLFDLSRGLERCLELRVPR